MESSDRGRSRKRFNTYQRLYQHAKRKILSNREVATDSDSDEYQEQAVLHPDSTTETESIQISETESKRKHSHELENERIGEETLPIAESSSSSSLVYSTDCSVASTSPSTDYSINIEHEDCDFTIIDELNRLKSVESESSNDNDTDPDCFKEELREWVCTHNVTHNATDDLLKILHKNGHAVPMTARTLLQTPTTFNTKCISNMEYYYLGLTKGLHDYLTELGSNEIDELCLSLNVDGLPLFKSSKTQVWPILCSIDNNQADRNVFIVAITCGSRKPCDLEFLQETIEELNALLENGLKHNDKDYTVKMNCFVCDAPARSFIKAVKQHTGYFSCDKCDLKGSWEGRVVYLETDNLNLRTNSSFRSRANAEHHQMHETPLCNLPIDMIAAFPLDYMHQACLGVMKRLLLMWLKGDKAVRISAQQASLISERLLALRSSIPKCFARKPRGLDEIDRWKATELRQFLLYSGKIVLKGILQDHLYVHFLKLSVALCILVSEHLNDKYNDVSKQLLTDFVKECVELYGNKFVVYNVHTLLHLPDDAKEFGCLDNCSGFPFENFLQHIKKTVRSGKNPLQQIVRRNVELNQRTHKRKNTIVSSISCHFPNNAYILGTSSVCDVLSTNGVDIEGNKTFRCRVYTNGQSLFTDPCDSQLVHALKVSTANSHIQILSQLQLVLRAIKIPKSRGRFIFLGILHTNSPKFAVVEFLKEGSVGVISTKWIAHDGEHELVCFWPPNNYSAQCRRHQEPDREIWRTHKIKVYSKKATWDDAKTRLRKAQNTSSQSELDDRRDNTQRQSVRVDLNKSDDECTGVRSTPVHQTSADLTFDVSTPSSVKRKRRSPMTSTPKSASTSQQSDFEKTVLRQLEKGNKDREEMKDMIHQLRNSLGRTTIEDDDEDDLLPRPLRNMQEFAHLDRTLQDSDARKKMVAILRNLAVSTVDKTVQNMLKHVATSAVWEHFSLKGQKGKNVFEKTEIFTCVIRACKKENFKQEPASNQMISFLKRAPYQPLGSKHKGGSETGAAVLTDSEDEDMEEGSDVPSAEV